MNESKIFELLSSKDVENRVLELYKCYSETWGETPSTMIRALFDALRENFYHQ